MTPHRILLVGAFPPPVGGMERMVQRLAQEFVRGRDDEYAIESIDTNKLPPVVMTPKLVKRWNHARVLRDLESRLPKADVVHMVTAWGDNFWRAADVCELALNAGKPTLLQLQSGKFATWFDERNAEEQQRTRDLFRRLDALAVLSPGWIDQLTAWVDPARCVVIPNVADVAEWPYVSHPGPTGEERPLRLVFTGRIERPKGLGELIAALDSFPRERFEIRLYGRLIDDGTAAIVREGQSHQRIELRGEVSPDDLAEAYAWADAFVFPTHYEGLPVALIEAMLSGLPVIASRVGAIGEMLAGLPADQTIRPQDPADLAQALRRLLAMTSTERQALGWANHQHAVERYSIDALRTACRSSWSRLLSR